MPRPTLADKQFKERAVEHTLPDVLRLLAWLHPTVAKEVCRRAYDECQRRESARRKSMLGPSMPKLNAQHKTLNFDA